MDPEDKRMLKHAVELSESNNKMLKKIYGDLVWKKVYSTIRWVIVIGLTIASYYYLQPILDSFFKSYENVTGQSSEFQKLFDGFFGKR